MPGGAGGVAPRGVPLSRFLEDLSAAGLAQLIHLALHRLAAGADAGVADQAGSLTIRHRVVCRPMTHGMWRHDAPVRGGQGQFTILEVTSKQVVENSSHSFAQAPKAP